MSPGKYIQRCLQPKWANLIESVTCPTILNTDRNIRDQKTSFQISNEDSSYQNTTWISKKKSCFVKYQMEWWWLAEIYETVWHILGGVAHIGAARILYLGLMRYRYISIYSLQLCLLGWLWYLCLVLSSPESSVPLLRVECISRQRRMQ